MTFYIFYIFVCKIINLYCNARVAHDDGQNWHTTNLQEMSLVVFFFILLSLFFPQYCCRIAELSCTMAENIRRHRFGIARPYFGCLFESRCRQFKSFEQYFAPRVSNSSSSAWKAIYNCKLFLFLIRAQNVSVLRLFLTQFIFRISFAHKTLR